MLSGNPSRAGFDWRAFARDAREAFARSNKGYRTLSQEIGVTLSDMSRAAGGTNISIEKVLAICDFMGVSERRYYQKPAKSTRFTARNVKHAKEERA